MPKRFGKPSHTSHTISRGGDLRRSGMPSTSHRKANPGKPAPLKGRCASCGKR